MKQNRFVVVVGNVGSGKSTLTDLLAKQLNATKVPADSLFTSNPFFPLATRDRHRWSFTSDLWFLRERVKLTKDIPALLKRGSVVTDSGLPMSFVYAHSRVTSGFFTASEWQLYQSIFQEMMTDICQPDVMIYLKASVPFLNRRIQQRGREFEIALYTPEYLKNLNSSIEVMVEDANKAGVQILPVDAEKSNLIQDLEELQRLVVAINGDP